MALRRWFIPPGLFFEELGGPEGIRTLGHLVKSQMLYLTELQAHGFVGLLPDILSIFYSNRSSGRTAYP
jgi:hypothetical protein